MSIREPWSNLCNLGSSMGTISVALRRFVKIFRQFSAWSRIAKSKTTMRNCSSDSHRTARSVALGPSGRNSRGRLMRCFPVSTRLNHVAYHDAACSAPVEFAQIQNRLFAWSGSRSIPRQRCTCWLGKRMSFLADFFEPRLAQSHTTVIIPLYKRVVFVGLLNCSEFSSRLSKVTQALYSITGIQFRVGGRGLDKRWSLGSVCISRCSSVREAVAELCAVWVSVYRCGSYCITPKACLLLVKYEDRLGTHAAAVPNRSVLTINLAAGSGLR